MERQELQTLRLWNPLFPKIYRKNEWGDTEYEPEDMDANEIVEYQEEILAAIEREKIPNEGERGLAVYLDNDVLKGKVYSINPAVEEWDGKLWGVTEVQTHGELTQAELDEVIAELTGQFQTVGVRDSSSDQLILPMEKCILVFGMQEINFLLNQKNN